ncbi:NADH dehydrogenase [ubiquinone] 1 beta subcomplex subunit 9 [Pocillopora verrucosa]|uniref:NADH dehydrogenase [ubiquinone] 1 beta subcomplex subunit 9 n=1 Tax=Pocillopora verrucosa TaxID=203993 RepID=UPI002797C04F|nr:NADH dehydrogenase [ubiquinone] 1 beta subcomplex subunit 9-like [Pocillopora verrucosa]
MAYVPSHLVKGITHQQRVMRLYRNSLRHLLDWVIDRQTWRQEAVKLRERFDAHKHEKDRRVIHKILEAAEREFEKHKHPFPYVHPDSPDGSKWERNIPPPPHMLHMLPWEEEWYKEMTEWANEKV